MKSGTIGCLKFKRLKRLLNRPEYVLVGLLESIWQLTARDASRGDIGRYSNEDIAAQIEWDGDANELIESLVEAGWLVESKRHRLVVHDWHDHCPNYIRAKLKKMRQSFASPEAESVLESDLKNGDHNDSGALKNGLKSDLKTEHQAKPSLTKPNQEITAASAGDAQIDREAKSPLPPPTDLENKPRWQIVIEQLRQRGIQHAAPAAFAARDAGCTIEEITAVVNHYDFRKCFDAAQLCHRIKHSRPAQPADDGWPVRNAPSETRSQEAKIEQEAHAAENQIVKAGRKKGVPDEAIREKIRAHFAAQRFPLRFSTWCSEVGQ